MAGARFDGQTAIVTGAGAGIGRELGARLAPEGAVVRVTDVDGDAAADAAGRMGPGHEGRTPDGRAVDRLTRSLAREVLDGLPAAPD